MRNLHIKAIFFICLGICHSAISQDIHNEINPQKFVLSGEIKGAHKGMVSLHGFFEDDSLDIEDNKVSISEKGEFAIKGKISTARAVMIKLEHTGTFNVTQPFFIDSGRQHIVLQIANFGKKNILVNNSKANDEYQKKFINSFERLNKAIDYKFSFYANIAKLYKNNIPEELNESLNKMKDYFSSERDHLQINYIKSNPLSAVSLWSILIDFSHKGYRSVYKNMFDELDNSVRESYYGRYFATKFQQSKALSIGSKFPIENLIDLDSNSVSLLQYKNKYTLVDFWYARCTPCIRSFNEMQYIYKKYHPGGFQIIAIGTDKHKDLSLLKETVIKYNYEWPQWWDVNRRLTNYYSIYSFPTSFLLDVNGIIIKRNISPNELEILLEKNL